jgi:hypothetical protein
MMIRFILVVSAIVYSGVFVVMGEETADIHARFIHLAAHGRNFGLSVIRDDEKSKVILAAGREWNLIPKEDRWLIVTNETKPNEKRQFLCVVREKPRDADSETVVLRDTPDESCLWEIDVEGKVDPRRSSQWYGTIRATFGHFRGQFLTLGGRFERMDHNGLKVQCATVKFEKEKSKQTRWMVWQDGK